MPRRSAPACPCAQCAADALKTHEHGTMPRYEAGCRCIICRMGAARLRRDLRIESDLDTAPRSWGDRPAARVAALLSDGWRP